MLDRVGEFAEEMANRISRRGLFGKFGSSALAAVGALVALPGGVARAHRVGTTSTCCMYYSASDDDYSAFFVKPGIACPPIQGFVVVRAIKVRSCADCSTD
jgi:hypothetical protein